MIENSCWRGINSQNVKTKWFWFARITWIVPANTLNFGSSVERYSKKKVLRSQQQIQCKMQKYIWMKLYVVVLMPTKIPFVMDCIVQYTPILHLIQPIQVSNNDNPLKHLLQVVIRIAMATHLKKNSMSLFLELSFLDRLSVVVVELASVLSAVVF